MNIHICVLVGYVCILLGIYLGMEVLGHKVGRSTLTKLSNTLPKCLYQCTLHQRCARVPLAPYLCQTLYFFFILTFLVSVTWYHLVVLLLLSLFSNPYLKQQLQTFFINFIFQAGYSFGVSIIITKVFSSPRTQFSSPFQAVLPC